MPIDYDLGDIKDSRPPKKHSSRTRTRSQSDRCTVSTSAPSPAKSWNGRKKRERKWFTYAEAKEALKDRPELQGARAVHDKR